MKESREAAISVIPGLGFSVNELGDHIPNPQTHSSHTKLFLQLSPKSKKEKTPSVVKCLANGPDLLATVCLSVLKHKFPPCSVVKSAYSKHPFTGWLTNMPEVCTLSQTTTRTINGSRGASVWSEQTKLMEHLCFSKRLLPQSEESEVIQISER